jgi:hypothetical protein
MLLFYSGFNVNVFMENVVIKEKWKEKEPNQMNFYKQKNDRSMISILIRHCYLYFSNRLADSNFFLADGVNKFGKIQYFII